MDLYNVKTRRKESIEDQEALQNALLSGTHSFESGARVPVIAPGGESATKSVPAENIQAAIQAGYQVETPRQKIVRDYVDDNKGLAGSLKVGLGQFADEAAIGLPELIFNKTADPLEVAKKEALKKEHSLANTLGGLGGFGASLFTGAPLWRTAAKTGEKVSAHLAEKLAVEGAEQVSKRSANKVAKDIVARMGGATTEGAIVALPQVVTEAALGDPDAAAQNMLAGAGLGAIFGGATGLGKEFLGLGKKVSDQAQKLIGERDLTLKRVARQASQVMTGVDEDDLLYYMKNSEKVNKAPTVEALKDQIDAAVRQRTDDVAVSRELLRDSELELKQAYNNARRDLSQARAPQEMADDLVAAMTAEKEVLGRMSDEADQILDRLPGEVQKNRLVDFVKKVKEDIVPIQVGKKSVQTARDLDALATRINDQLDDAVSFPRVREVLQQVRNDIDWNTLSSEFNTQSNKAFKGFQKNVSNLLKDQSPEYAEQMARMSRRADALDKMNKNFGNREKAASTLNRILRPGGEVKSELLDEFSTITGTNFTERLSGLRRAKDQLERSSRGDISAELVPNLTAKRDSLRKQLADAEEALRPVQKLTPDRTQSAIRNMGYKQPNIATRRAFESLEQATGTPYLEMIADRNVLDAFEKAYVQGSRKTNLVSTIGFASGGGLAGLATGGPIGAAAGAIAGATLDQYGGNILKNLIDRNPNVAGLLFVEKAIKRTADKLDDIPKIIQRTAQGERLRKSTIPIAGLWRIFDEDADPDLSEMQEPGKQLEKFDEKIRTYLVNEGSFSNMISKFSMPLREGGAPNISEAMTGGTRRALEYLYAKIPREPEPSSPFAPKIAWEPSSYELNKFAQALQVAREPFSVLEEYQAGTLTEDHMEALNSMFPVVAQEIQGKIMEYASNPEAQSLPYEQRLSLSILAGVPLDSSLQGSEILSLQRRFLEGDEGRAEAEDNFVPRRQINIAKNSATKLQAAMER